MHCAANQDSTQQRILIELCSDPVPEKSREAGNQAGTGQVQKEFLRKASQGKEGFIGRGDGDRKRRRR